ncbi:MAG: hypothetical protein L3K13_07975 [Thermoplasmata archaeon]|nr:hypothetical protein [Thermoplasmata archaeon]
MLRRVALGSVALVVLMATPIDAGSVSSFVITAPYTGASTFAHNPSLLHRCRATSILVPPTVKASTGSVVSSSKARACPGMYVDFHTDAGFLGPAFHVRTTAARSVTFNWTVSWNMAIHQGVGISAGGSWGKITLFANLLDNTTGSWVLGGLHPSNRIYVVAYPTPRGGAGSGNHSYSLKVSANLTSGDPYLFYTGFGTLADANCAPCFSMGKGQYALGTVDVGSPGHGAWLNWIRVR